MAGSRVELMVGRLGELLASTPGLEAAAVVSTDGLAIASALPNTVEEDPVSAMSAAMLSVGDRVVGELQRGSLKQVYVRGTRGYTLLMSVGEEAVLTVLGREGAKLGLVFPGMRQAVEDLADLL